MSDHSTIPPLSVPEDEARILDPKHPDCDSLLRDDVRNEAIIPSNFDDGNKEDAEIANNVALIQALGDMTANERENTKRCICSEAATKSAFQSYPPPDKKGVFEDKNEDYGLGDDPYKAAAWDHLEEDGVLDPEDYREPGELAQSEAADKDSVIPPPNDEDNSAKVAADNAEMEKIAAILSVVEAIENALKVNVIYNAVGMSKGVEEIAVIVKKILEAENDDEVLKICEAEGVSIETEDEEEPEA